MNTANLSQLAQARQDAEYAKQRMNEIIDAAKATLDYREYEIAYKAAQEDIDVFTAVVKEDALKEYQATEIKQLPGVTIKIMKRYVCTDETAAEAWAHNNKRFLQIDWRSFEKEAKQLHGSIYQFPFYEERLEPQAQIKSDLSEFIQPD